MKLAHTLAKDESLILPKHREIETQVLELFTQHLNLDWQLKWSTEKNALGRCFYGERIITLSQYWMLFISDQEITDVILHEIAHGMTWEQYLKDKKEVPYNLHKKLSKMYLGHGGPWEYFAKKIGATGTECYEGNIRLPSVKNKLQSKS